MNNRYQIEISEIKGKLNLGKNPWYVEIPLTIFLGIPLIIFGGLFWLIGNGFYYIFIKPFEKEKKWIDLKWTEFKKLKNINLKKSDPINVFLDKKQQEWIDEDPVYALNIESNDKLLDGKIFTDFIQVFDDKIFLQELFPVELEQKYEIKSKLISIHGGTLELEEVREFDYYYLEAATNNNELQITGTDQLGSKFELKIKSTLANNGYT